MYIPVKFTNGIQKIDAEIQPRTFKEMNLHEKDIEEFLRKNIDVIFGDEETLLVVGQQVRDQTRGVSDLTAIDANGNIVLIEIKRDIDDIKSRREPFEFQAVRYAASYAKIQNPEEIVELVYSAYIERHKDEYELGDLTSSEKARRELNQFLASNNAVKTFNSKQRIILIASAFDDQTLSAVAWLIANKVDISCFTITPADVGEQQFLEIEKLLPPPKLDDYYIGITSVGTAAATTPQSSGITAVARTITRTWLPRMTKLFEWGLIKPGDQVKIKNFADSEAEAVNSAYVRYKGEEMKYNDWGQNVTGWSSINIYDWTVLIEKNETLSDLRAEKMAELEQKTEDVGEQLEEFDVKQ